jgi:hypothetical protein
MKNMKHLKSIFLFALLLAATLGLRAQSGNVVVADLKVYDMGDGSGMIVAHIAGNQAENYTGGTFAITGDLVAGRIATGGIGDNTRLPVDPITPGNGGGNTNGNQQVVIAAVFPILQPTGNESDDFHVQVTLHPRFGNGLDYTFSMTSRHRRRSMNGY